VSHDPELDPLVADVYDELRRLADQYVRRERFQSVQATELVHEAYLRLATTATPEWQSRAHFTAIAAIAMRRLLVERARRRGAAKRGSTPIHVTLDESLLAGHHPGHDVDVLALDVVSGVVALDRALSRLQALSPEQARIVELRYFGGLSVEETAEALGSSPATIKRHWAVARAFLLRDIEGQTPA
jgi:RNA polymerase sigma factor (TIGR02999 family)